MPQYAGKAQLPRSLQPLGGVGVDDGGDVGLGPAGGIYATMRPGLRNALADAYGEHALDSLRDLEPTVFHRAGSSQVPGFLGGPMDEVYDPENDAPIAANERARRQTMLNADQQTDLHTIYDPINAQTGQRVKDIGAAGDLARYWDPSNQAMEEQEFGRKYSMAVDPANIAAKNRLDVENLQGLWNERAATARRPATNFAQLFDSIAKTYPADPRTGERQLPPEIEALRQAIAGYTEQGVSGGAPGGPAATPGDLTPEEQGFVQRAQEHGYSGAQIQDAIKRRRAAAGGG